MLFESDEMVVCWCVDVCVVFDEYFLFVVVIWCIEEIYVVVIVC